MFTWILELKLNSVLTDREWMDLAVFLNNHQTMRDKVIEITKANSLEGQGGHMKQMKVVKDCTCQHDEHEVSHHYREKLKIKELKKDDVVEFVKEWHNIYGKFIRVKKDGHTYDIKPENLAVLST